MTGMRRKETRGITFGKRRPGAGNCLPWLWQIGIIGGVILLGMLIGKIPYALFSMEQFFPLSGGLLTAGGVCAALAVFTWDVLVITGLWDCLLALERREVLRIVAFVLLTNLFLVLFVCSENYIRFWDQSAYWKRTINFMNALYADPLDAVHWTWYTVNHADYNLLISLFLSFPMKLTGISFLSFILWVWNLFSVPSILVLELILKKIRPGYFLGCLEVVLTPMFLIIIVEGFGDSLALLFSVLAIALMADGKYYEEFDAGLCFFVFAAVMGAMVSRRYFGPFGVGYVAAVLLSYFGAREREPVEFFKNLACTGLFTAAGMLLCHGFVEMSLLIDHSLQYSAYRTGGVAENFVMAMESFGGVVLVLAALGLWQLLSKPALKRFGLFLTVQIVVTSVAVFYILDLYIQQYYVIIPAVTMLALTGFQYLAERRSRPGVIVAAALLAFQFLNCFLDFRLPAPVSYLCSSQIRKPQVRHDLEQIRQMTADLNGLLGNEEGQVSWSQSTSGNGKTVYCIASSDTLNFEVLRHCELPEKLESVPGLLGTYDVDLRDGFPQSFLSADYLIVTDPSQYHLLKDGQRTVVMLNEEILYGGPLAEHFRQIGSYALDNGVTAYLYERITAFEEEDIIYIRQMFDQYYGDFPEIFHDRIVMPESSLEEN